MNQVSVYKLPSQGIMINKRRKQNMKRFNKTLWKSFHKVRKSPSNVLSPSRSRLIIRTDQLPFRGESAKRSGIMKGSNVSKRSKMKRVVKKPMQTKSYRKGKWVKSTSFRRS